MKHIPRHLPLLVLILCGVSVALPGTEEEISLSEVPVMILATAQDEMPGIELTRAGVEKTDKGLVYELEGTVNGEKFEIEISADGTVLDIESKKDGDEVDDDDVGEDVDKDNEEDEDEEERED